MLRKGDESSRDVAVLLTVSRKVKRIIQQRKMKNVFLCLSVKKKVRRKYVRAHTILTKHLMMCMGHSGCSNNFNLLSVIYVSDLDCLPADP